MKRYLAIIICVFVLFSITACGQSQNGTESGVGSSFSEKLKNPFDPSRYSPEEASAFSGMDFAQVEALFQKAGFEKIIAVPVDDIDSSSDIADGSVESVTIDGLSEYTSETPFNVDSEVIITYHNVPKLAVPFTSTEAEHKYYMEVGKAFFDAGFLSVQTDEVYDLSVGADSQTVISSNGKLLTDEVQLPFDSSIDVIEHYPISAYLTTVNVDFQTNLLFSKYNVAVSLDGESMGTLPHGESGTYELSLPVGNHELVFSKENESEISNRVMLDVNSETSATYSISCNRKTVDIELVNLTHALTDSNLLMPFSVSHYLRKDYRSVVQELEALGFVNVSAEAATDAFWAPDPVNTVVGVEIGGKSNFARDDLLDKTAPVTVFYHVADFAFDQTAVKVTEKDTFDLPYTLSSGDSLESISFEIDNPDVLKQNEDGSYTALMPGKATITASGGGNFYSECAVEVSKLIIPIEKIDFASDEIAVSVGSTFKVDFVIIPENANYTEMRAEISNDLVEAVENNLFYSNEAGDSEISFYQDEKLLGTCAIHGTFVEIEELSFEDAAEETDIGDTLDIPLRFVPENATNKGVSVTSSDPQIAEVVFDERGASVVKVAGKAAGEATITVTVPGGAAYTHTITVKEVDPKEIKLENPEPDQRIEVGTLVTLNIGWEPENTSEKLLTWTSSDTGVIRVDAEGNLEAVGLGTAEITAGHKSGLTSTISLTVEPTLVKEIEATTDRAEAEKIYAGDRVTITTSVKPDNATSKNVTFSSSDESVATVSDKGIVTAVGAGSVTITIASPDGPKLDVPVTVSPSPQKFRITWADGLVYNESVGDTWYRAFYVNDKPFTNGSTIILGPDSSFTIYYYVEEWDEDNPDVGTYCEEIPYSYDICKNGYRISVPVNVIENSGPYKNHSATWRLQVKIEPVN